MVGVGDYVLEMNSNSRLMFVLVGLACSCWAADPVFPVHSLGNSQIRDLPKSANGREYRLLVGLPYSYGTQPTKRYPVLYILDGFWDFTLVNGMYGNLLYDKAVPEFIIVGHSYPGENPKFDSLRNYDYQPVADPSRDPKALTTGHGADFLDVLRKQIIPFVQKEYRVDTTFRVLGGSSLGGIFALYAAYEAPGLFQGVIAASPAIKPFEPWFLPYEAAYARKSKSLPVRMFLSTAGEEWPDFSQGIRRFHDTLESRHYKGLALKWRVVDGERHAGTKAESYSRGLRWVFEGLAPDPNGK